MSTVSFTLPPGIAVGIRILNSLPADKIFEFSRLILSDITKLGDIKCQLEGSLGISSADLGSLLDAALSLWRNIAFHQPKRNILEDNLKAISLSEKSIAALISCWEAEGPTVNERLLEETCSGLPKLRDVDWGIEVMHSNSITPKMREPRLRLDLDTDQGRQTVHLTYDEAVKLYGATNHIQEALDRLLE